MTRPTSTNQKIVRGVAGGLCLTAVNIGISFLQLRFLLKYLPLGSAGVWMIFINLGNYVLLLDLGLSPTFGREISFASGDPKLPEEARQQRIATLIRSCTVAVAALAAITVTVGSVAGWHYLLTVVAPVPRNGLLPAWCIFACGASLNLLGEGWLAGLYGLGHVFEEKLVRAGGACIGFVFFLTALFLHQGFLGLSLAFLLQAISTLLLARFTLRRYLENGNSTINFDFGVLKALVGPSLRYAATVLGGVLILQTDNLVIASIFGTSAVPAYQAVSRLVTVLMSLSMMLITSSAPVISQAYARGDSKAIVQVLTRNLRFSLTVMVVLGSFIACFADRLIALWIGPGRFVGFPIVWILLAMMLLEAHHLSMASATMATGHIVFLAPALIAGVLNLGFSVFFAHRLGLVGVALGTLAAQLLTNNWYVPWYTIRLFQIKISQHIGSIILPISCLIILALLTGYAARIFTQQLPAFLSLILGAACVIALGCLGVFTLLFGKEERVFLLNKVATLIGRSRSLPISLMD